MCGRLSGRSRRCAGFNRTVMHCASSVTPGAEQGPDRKTAGLLFMAKHSPHGLWLAIQSLRPTRAEASQTGNHVPRWERRSPSLHEGELPCLQAKQRECRGPSACSSVGRDASARRTSRHRAWRRCCALPKRESAFVGESSGHMANHSPDEARFAFRVPPQAMPIRRRSSNQGSPPSPLGVPRRSPTKESTPC
jgi:hypothetical protein